MTEGEKEYLGARNSHLEYVIQHRGYAYATENFSKFTSRQTLTRFLAHNDIFKRILNIQGSVIECGVYLGQSLMTWAQLSAIYEPVGGATREIFGFDTFSGFPSISQFDYAPDVPQHEIGDLKTTNNLGNTVFEELLKEIEIFDKNRLLPQFHKVKLIKGDFRKTHLDFIRENAHVIPALLYLDFDLYEPTALAIKTFMPRMPKGSIIAFDELNDRNWPGEARALLESLDINSHSITKIGYDTKICYLTI